jgi:hypothetical protein
LRKAADHLVNEAEIAYQFNAGSYTWSSLAAAVQFRAMLVNEPDWIDLYDEFASAPPPEAGSTPPPAPLPLWLGFQTNELESKLVHTSVPS